MADSSAATGLTVQQWDANYFTEAINEHVFKPFMGTGTSNMIQVKSQLEKKPGDSVTYALVNKLTNSAVTGSSTLEGNEEDMTSRSHKVTIDQYRNAVRVPVLEDQFSAIPLRQAAKDVLKDWSLELWRDQTIEALGSINGTAYGSASEANKDAWLVDNADRCLFGDAVGNGSYTDHSADLATVTAAMTLDSSAVSLLKRIAKTASPRIRPIKARSGNKTSDAFVLFCNSLVMRDLATDSAFQQANREARMRGVSNPLFKGADYIWDNIAIYEVEDIAVLSGVGAASADVSPVYLCGAQAIGHAWAKRPQSVEEAFDYNDKQGIAIRQWYGIEKLRFGSGSGDTDDLKDHGVVTGFFGSAADS